MNRLVHSLGLFLAFCILSHARHTVFISQNGTKTYSSSLSETDVCMSPTCVIAAAEILTKIDETVDPCDDFYRFACGGWLKKQEVSDEKPSINLFTETRTVLNQKLKDLLESKYKSSDPQFVKMLKDFYNTCVDLDKLEKDGSEPLKKILTRLGGWPVVEGGQWDESTFDWVETLISFRKLGYKFNIMFNLYVNFNPEIGNVTMLYLGRSYRGLSYTNLSLGLDDKDIDAYYRKMVKAAKLLGADESAAQKELLDALHFEMALKNISTSKKEEKKTILGFFKKSSSKKLNTFAQLQTEFPQVPWLKLINGLLLNDQATENETIVNDNPDFLVKFVDLIASTDKRVIANYMLWQAVLQSKDFLSEEWRNIEDDEDDENLSKTPRWKYCLSRVQEHMEIALSSYYVRHYLSDASKDEAMIMVEYVHKEFLKILDNNDWMDEKTRKKAEEKAHAIKRYIGYPKELLNDTFVMKTYENLTITTDSFLENILALNENDMDKELSTLGEIPDEKSLMIYESKYRYLMEVNAFYNPIVNSIAIPAGILHDAFYDKDKPKYINFGVMGSIIGHEITHGFDNDGRRYDKDGNRVRWWDKETDKHFRKKVKCIIDQYENYTTDIGLKVNGKKTQNENIADNGGMKEAYLAYHSWTKDHGIEPLLPGVKYTQDQIFWLSAAHGECSKYQPEKLKEMILFDEHSPGRFRVIGPMSNLAEFSNDFKCSPDAPMNRKYKCEVW